MFTYLVGCPFCLDVVFSGVGSVVEITLTCKLNNDILYIDENFYDILQVLGNVKRQALPISQSGFPLLSFGKVDVAPHLGSVHFGVVLLPHDCAAHFLVSLKGSVVVKATFYKLTLILRKFCDKRRYQKNRFFA